MAIVKKDDMMELGRFCISELIFDGHDPARAYITKEKKSIVQNAEAKAILLKLVKQVEKMKARGIRRDELKRIATYAYILFETEEHTMDLKRAKEDLGIDKLVSKYVA